MKDTLQPLVKQFMPFAQERMGFDKPPRLFLRNDLKNAQNPLGKTAYYDPEQMSVTLYIDGRHPKDIMRSLSHELVHHTQNCNGQFDHVGEMGEGYAQNDEHLREMERQAYEEGNLCFRDWEDSIKGTIYNESLQKGAKNKMSLKNWKDNELSTLLTEKWGFSFNLLTESENRKDPAGDEQSRRGPRPGEKEDPDVQRQRKRDADKVKDDGGDGYYDGGADQYVGADSFNDEELDENAFAPNHYCVHHGGVDRNGSVELAEAVQHNYNNELGRVTHYDMKFADGTIMENVAFEDIQVTNASLEEMHGGHAAKRDEEELDERRGRGRDREGMEPDSRRRAMSEGEDQEELEEGGKPDFLDLDKDGDKEESMKDAAADKKGKMDEAKIRNLIRKLVKEAAKRGR
tara:strand:+ start:63 stop:1268 length:1206 start_codon:yes stop_codon:yes gene_type:complete